MTYMKLLSYERNSFFSSYHCRHLEVTNMCKNCGLYFMVTWEEMIVYMRTRSSK